MYVVERIFREHHFVMFETTNGCYIYTIEFTYNQVCPELLHVQ